MATSDEPAPGEPQQIAIMRRLVDLSIERTQMSAQRSEMSAERSYMNAERTLSVWIRTALAAMVVGIAIDRFGLFLREDSVKGIKPDEASTWVGMALVALGILMTVVTAIRFWLYAVAYRREHEIPHYHGAFMAPAFSLLVGLFGVVLLVLLGVSPD